MQTKGAAGPSGFEGREPRLARHHLNTPRITHIILTDLGFCIPQMQKLWTCLLNELPSWLKMTRFFAFTPGIHRGQSKGLQQKRKRRKT
jgi:hypothetical protein